MSWGVEDSLLIAAASGVSAWLAVYNLVVFAVRRQRLSLWVMLWSAASLAYQGARFGQLTAETDVRRALMDQLCFATAVVLIPLLSLAIGELTGVKRRATRWIIAVSGVALVLHATTDLFIGRTPSSFQSFTGKAVLFTQVGPLYAPLLIPLSLGALAVGIGMVRASTSLTRREKLMWLGAMVAYQLVGGNDVLLFSGLQHWLLPGSPAHTLFEFGAVGMALALSLRTAHRSETSQQQLESLVHERTAALERALEEARRAAQAKSAFLASMSHEVRTPLNGIIGLTEMSLDEAGPALREKLELVLRSGRQLKVMVDDVLDFARLDARRLVLAPVVFRPASTCEDVVALFDANARSRGLTLTLEARGLPEHVEADEVRLRQILSNLVANAVKFTERGGVTVVVTLEEGPALRVAVRDTGPGISPEDQARLFQPFTQVGVAMNSPGLGGTGLGLAISRQLAELMSGAISLESRVGEGSTFVLTLPVKLATAPTPAPEHAQHRRFQGRVLVAEDNPVNRLVAAGLLKTFGVSPVLVEDGEAAREAGAKGAWDLVLMDCQMPRLDGFEATKRLRAEGVVAPIVALTAFASDEDRAKCLACGMNDYLTKPLRRAELGALLERYLVAA